ncbi:MAG: branched-chain amino acid ABC transporter permease [Candidatus Rokubacteria bacterium]|nr:branched-chain amino acid ABC transporter permease [Candidatus Rokubacteria bacterium]
MRRLTWIGAGLVAAALLLLPPLSGFHPYYLYLVSTALLFGTLATAWNLLAYAGQISFGHAAFFGLGAYGAALASLGRFSPWWAIVLGGLLGAGGAGVIGLASARLQGAYLALATLAYAEIWRGIAHNWSEVSGGGAGLIGIPPLPPLPWLPLDFTRGRAGSYYLSLAFLLVVLALFAGILHSRLGLAFAAVREEEERASLLGVHPLPWKILAFALSGFFSALAGGLYVHMVRVVEPDLVFSRYFSILPLVMATFGGLHTLLGPATAALGLYLVSELLLQPYVPVFHQLPYGLALIVVVLYLPGGLAGLLPSPRPSPHRGEGR